MNIQRKENALNILKVFNFRKFGFCLIFAWINFLLNLRIEAFRNQSI
jgi:hypothetical protein